MLNGPVARRLEPCRTRLLAKYRDCPHDVPNATTCSLHQSYRARASKVAHPNPVKACRLRIELAVQIVRSTELCPRVKIRNAGNREAGMRSCLVSPSKPFPSVRIAFIAVLTLLLSGWTTYSAIIEFNSCQGSIPQPQSRSLSPGIIPGDADSVLLTVNGAALFPNRRSCGTATRCRPRSRTQAILRPRLPSRPLTSLAAQRETMCRFQ